MNNYYRPVWAEIMTGIAGAVAEWLFAMLPLVVVAVIVTLYLGELSPWFETPEWAFGASILAGQALVRFFAGAVRVTNLSLKRVLLSVSVLSAITVVPTNIVLILVLQSDLSKNFVSSLLATLGRCALNGVLYP